MNITILGWYGHRNIGDEAMLEGLHILLNRFFGKPEIKVMSDNSEQVPEFNVKEINEGDLLILGGGELINRDRIFIDMPGWEQKIKIPKNCYLCSRFYFIIPTPQWKLNFRRHFSLLFTF